MTEHHRTKSVSHVFGWAIFESEMRCQSWGGFLESVQTGKTVTEIVGQETRFEWMARDPQKVALFDTAKQRAY